MQTSEALRAFFSRAAAAIPELYNMAYAICGNHDLAEYSVQYALMEAWLGESHGGIGFREGLRNAVRRVALEEALEPRAEAVEFTWDGMTAPGEDPVLRQLAQESLDTRRAVALRYGCALPVARVAKVMDLPAGKVRELLDRFERAVRRRMPAQEKRRLDIRLARTIGRAFDRPDENMPSLGALYRSFEADAAETRRPKHLVSKIIGRIMLALLAVVCALMFWLAAALIQPTPLEEPPAIVTEESP